MSYVLGKPSCKKKISFGHCPNYLSPPLTIQSLCKRGRMSLWTLLQHSNIWGSLFLTGEYIYIWWWRPVVKSIPNLQLGDDMVQICVGGTGHQFERRQKHCKETWRTGAFQNSGPPDEICWIIVLPIAALANKKFTENFCNFSWSWLFRFYNLFCAEGQK